MSYHYICTGAYCDCQPCDYVPYYQISENGQQHSDDADGEIVHEHFEAGLYFPFHQTVELLDAPSGKRSHYHGSYEHRYLAPGDYSDGSYGSYDTASVTSGVTASRITYQQRQKIGKHCRNELRKPFVRHPS